LILIFLLAVSGFEAFEPTMQAQSDVTNLTLTFHNYSVILRDSNGSFVVYDGADGARDSQATTQETLTSQISGTRMGYNYWSAAILWAVKLPMDLHVKGTVNVYAYLSSTFKQSMLGGGYAMGVVDIDENNVEVKEFLTEAPYSFGNPFSATPTQYSQNINVDYTFKKGHAIGFAVGFGGTTQGYSATVYFGSADRASGATLPVIETWQTQLCMAEGAQITVKSNSAVENLQYSQAGRCISFSALGIHYTTGTCIVSVPKTLLQSPFTVTVGAQSITPTQTEDATYYQLSFTHSRTADTISIVGEAPPSPTPASSTSTAPIQTASPTQPTQTASSPPQTTDSLPPTPTPTPELSAVIVLAGIGLLTLSLLMLLFIQKRQQHK
jgi:hypothetical protein